MEERPEKRRKRRRAKKGKTKILWGRLIAILLVLFLIIGGIGFGCYSVYKIYTAKQEKPTNVAVKTINVKTEQLQQESLDKPMYILVVGVEQQRNNLIDSLYLLSINKEGNQLDLIGIPLDSKITARDGKSVSMISTMYTIGGLDLTKAVVEDIFHVKIPYYVVYNEETFPNIMKMIGENDMYIESNMTQYDESSKDISLLQGYQKMDVTKAWSYMSYVGSDESGIEKIQRQERFIKTQIDANRSSNLIMQEHNIWRNWSKLETNISTFDAMKLAFSRNDIPQENYHYFIVPGAKEKLENEIYWDIDPIEVQRLVGLTINYDGGINEK